MHYSFNVSFFVRYFLLASFVLTISCSPERRSMPQRAPAPDPIIKKPAVIEGRDLTSQELIDIFFDQSSTKDACQVLFSLPKAPSTVERFRLLESASVHRGSDVDAKGDFKHKDCRFICANPRHWGSERCRICKEEPLDLIDIWGRVGVGSHPIYEIALQDIDLPNQSEFMKLVEQERSKYGLVMWPFFETYKSLIHIGIKDAIKMRNDIIQDRINKAFPGAFDRINETSKMEDSLTLALIFNALPNYSSLLILPYDSPKKKSQKIETMKKIERALSRPLPYFRSKSWIDFGSDAVTSLNASVKSLQSTDPVQHACSMSLLHRNFAQMIRLIGYARMPVYTDVKTGHSAFSVPFERLLDSPSGTKFKTCPAPGSFVLKDGTRLMLNEALISNYASSRNKIQLSGQIETLRTCRSEDARYNDAKSSERFAFGKSTSKARVEDHLALLKVLSHQLTAFNPSSNWWNRSPMGYPLGEFSDFETIVRSGAVLPYQYHALALGLTQISLDSLVENHIVQIDSSFLKANNDRKVVGIRIDSKPRSSNSKELVETSIDTALMMTEIAFKAGAYLKQLPKWRADQARFNSQSLAKMSSKFEKFNFQKSQNNFVEGLFGAQENLSFLVGLKSLPTGASVAETVDPLKLGSALLLASFAIKADTTDLEAYTCSTKILTDVNKGAEEKIGRCSKNQELAWKKTFSWLSKVYRSPLFAAYAK